jgi:hypothetical protein
VISASTQQAQPFPTRPRVLGDRHLRGAAQRFDQQLVRFRGDRLGGLQVVAVADPDRDGVSGTKPTISIAFAVGSGNSRSSSSEIGMTWSLAYS